MSWAEREQTKPGLASQYSAVGMWGASVSCPHALFRQDGLKARETNSKISLPFLKLPFSDILSQRSKITLHNSGYIKLIESYIRLIKVPQIIKIIISKYLHKISWISLYNFGDSIYFVVKAAQLLIFKAYNISCSFVATEDLDSRNPRIWNLLLSSSWVTWHGICICLQTSSKSSSTQQF